MSLEGMKIFSFKTLIHYPFFFFFLRTELAKITGELVKAMTPLNKKQKREMLVCQLYLS